MPNMSQFREKLARFFAWYGDEKTPPGWATAQEGELVRDVGVGDVVGFGVLLGVGVVEDTEGEIIAIVEGIVMDAGGTTENADGFKRGTAAECLPFDTRHVTQVANRLQTT